MEPDLQLEEETTAMDESNAIPEDGGMNPDDAAAALGFATTLAQQMLPQEESVDNAEVAGEEEMLQEEEEPDTGMEERLMEEIDKLREEIGQDDMQKEIRSIKKELEELTKEEHEE